MADELPLSGLTSDFESIRARLQARLALRPSWDGNLVTQTGQTLIDMIATVGAGAQFKAMRNKQDAYAETAVSPRALYAIADMQGLRLTRKAPAIATANATYNKPNVGSPATKTIPAFTQYQAAGTYWFTDQSYVIADGATVPIELHQGYVVDQTLQGTGRDYTVFVSPEAGFSVSDKDAHVQVFNGSTKVERTTSGLWLYPDAPAFLDRTTPDGRLRLQFGTETYGYKPGSADTVRIRYAVTSGEDGNNQQTLTAKLTPTVVLDGITHTFTSNPSGGSNEPPAVVYKTLSPADFGSFGSAVTEQQHLAAALAYPGILDVKLAAQRDLDPTDLKRMNTIRATPLTSGSVAWTPSQRNAFIREMEKKSMFSPAWYIVDPTPVPRTIRCTVYCYAFANSSECAASAEAALRTLFSKRRGILGFDIYMTDLHQAVMASNPGIEYVDFVNPQDDLIVSGLPLPAPRVDIITGAGGVLPAGSYAYALYVNDSRGFTAPVNYSPVLAPAGNSSIKLDWDAYPGAVNYYVVGRGPLYGVLATLSANARTWTDLGTLTASTDPLPTPAGYPVLYNSAASINVSAEYSTR